MAKRLRQITLCKTFIIVIKFHHYMCPSANSAQPDEPPANHKRYIRIPVGNTREEHNVPAEDVAHVESTGGNTCCIYFKDPLTKKYISEKISRGIGEVEDRILNLSDFVRVHNCHIINLGHIHRHIICDRTVKLLNENIVPVSRTLAGDFFDDVTDL